MSCRNCEDRPAGDEHDGSAAPAWAVERISGLRCARCGALLGAEDIVRLLLEKQSQLERFGLFQPPSFGSRSVTRTLPFVRLESD